MTREELKTIKDLVMDMGKDIQGQRHYQHWEAYDKDEADSVMDAMEKRIHELEFEKGMLEVKADARGAVIKLNEERITMLKKHLEDVQNTMATENTDIGMENHKLKERIKELEDELQVANRCAEDARERIKELEASQPKWISVLERLPETRHEFFSKDIFIDRKEYEGKVSEESDEVIVLMKNGEICTAKYQHGLPIPFLNEEEWFGWHNYYNGYDFYNDEKITHWMPLPPLPTTEKTSAVQPPKSEE